MDRPSDTIDGSPASRQATIRRAGLGLLFVIVLLSTGVFAPGLVDPGPGSLLQQGVVELCWIGIVVLGLVGEPIDRIVPTRRIGVMVTFVFYAALSTLWAGAGVESLMKGAVLAFNVFALYLMVTRQPFGDVVDTIVAGLFALVAASVGLVVAFPDIAILETWQHAGQWSGVFDQKQTLGITSGILLYLASMRMGDHPSRLGRLYHLLVLATAALCLIGAGSRGGGVVAVGAILLGLVSARSPAVTRIASVMPIVTLAISAAMMAMLHSTDRNVLSIGETDIDFTERTKIWKHALDYMSDGNRLFGNGLNGFWSRKDVADAFIGQNNWFLDNYHNGALAIFGECGLIGVILFVLATLFLIQGADLPTERAAFEKKALIIGFLTLFYVINMTETYMLRSTNMASMMFFYFYFSLFSTPLADARPVPGRQP